MERRASPTTQLEIDEAILDYLLYTAIRALLEDARSRRKAEVRKLGDRIPRKRRRLETKPHIQPDLALQMVDSFLITFRAMHPDQHGSEELQFRLRLLKFTALFTTRPASSNISSLEAARESLEHKLQDLRNSYHNGDETNSDLGPISLADILTTPAPDKPRPTNPPASNLSISLLTTLPHFMALSAAHISLQNLTITPIWMRLAAGYMAQAVIEQSLTDNFIRPDILQEAFAYKPDPELDVEKGTDAWNINAMFFGKDEEVVSEWGEIRQDHMRTLDPPGGWSLQKHLRSLLGSKLSLSVLKEQMLDFLEDLLVTHPKPVLVQLEAGEIDGFSQMEISTIKRAVGWGVE